MGRTLNSCVGYAAIIGLTGTLALAGPPADGPACIIYGGAGHGPLVVTPPADTAQRTPVTSAPTVLIIDNAIVAPAAVVDRGLALQPTYSGLTVLQFADVPTIFDPFADYRRHDVPAGLDENHSLMKAQREYIAHHTGGPAQIIWGTAAKPPVAAVPQPVMMLIRPTMPPNDAQDAPAPAPIPSPEQVKPANPPAVPAQTPAIPSVPAPQKPVSQMAAVE